MDGIQHLIDNVLAIKNESLIFIYDLLYESLLNAFSDCCAQRNIPFENLQVHYDGINIPDKIKSTLKDGRHNIIVFGLKENIWHNNFRKDAKYKHNKKIISLTCPYARIFEEGNYKNSILKCLGKDIYPFFEESVEVEISSRSGTLIKAIIEKSFCEDGDYTREKTGGDFPAGEIGFGPKTESVNGTIVYDLKVQHIGKVDEVVISVENDKIVGISGKNKLEFKKIIDRHDSLYYISEISMGINPFIRINNDFSIIEEKILGTMHFGQGANLSYGSRKGLHMDSVIQKPTFKIGNKVILNNGELNNEILSSESIEELNQCVIS